MNRDRHGLIGIGAGVNAEAANRWQIMTAQSKSIRPRAGSVTPTLLVLASLGLNVFLAAQLLHRRPSLPLQPASAAADHKPGLAAPGTASTAPSTVADSGATNLPVSFHWSAVEADDYRRYIANLRAVGCPEQVIRDVILADVNQVFAPRFAAIWRSRVVEYWQKYKREQLSPDQIKQSLALGKDKAAILMELLGVQVSEQEMIDALHLQLHGSEQELLFLPADRREAALQALADADFETKVGELRSREHYTQAEEQKLYEQKLKLLAEVLSPEELLEFRIRNSATAQSLRAEVEYFNCTPEEFRQLMESRERAGSKNLGNLADRSAATEEVRKLFGDERAKEFERVTDLYYINARRAAEEQGVPLDRVDQAWQVTRNARAAAGLAAKDGKLSADERARQVQWLVQQAEARLIELLGQKAAAGVIRDLRVGYNVKPSP